MRRATRNISLTLLLVVWPSSAFALLGVGDKAPPLSISDWVKGAPVDFAKDIGKKIYVVEFWATWCPPCKASVPRLTDFQSLVQASFTFFRMSAWQPFPGRRFTALRTTASTNCDSATPSR